VDDNADNRTLLRFILEQYQAEVVEAASARDALALLPQVQPRLLISDGEMSQEDSYWLMRQIRSQEASLGGTVLAIALIPFAKTEDQQEALAAGFQRYLAKPIDPDRLIATILNLTQTQAH
jgi:CheY-like chemotaxis protein